MKKHLLVLICIVALLATAPRASAQGCAVCTKTASTLGDKGARGLNGGILYLAAIPLSLIGAIGFIWWRHNKNS